MPIIHVSMVEGRTEAQLRSLIAELTDAAVRAIDASPDSVRVILNEVSATHFAAGNVTMEERKQL